MFAIVSIGGKQYRVSSGGNIDVERLVAKAGDTVFINDVVLLCDGSAVKLGMPNLADVKVKAKVLKHFRGDKVIIFKKRRRKNSKNKNGYRSSFTNLLITDIIV